MLFYAGAAALAMVMFTDAFAVVGRHLGVPLLGAIELIQAAILVAASTAMVMATLAGSHARVRLLLDRLPSGGRLALTRLNGLSTAAFFLALTGGSVWITADLWGAHEESEVLRLPYLPLRIMTILATATLTVLFVRQAVIGQQRDQEAEDDAPTSDPSRS